MINPNRLTYPQFLILVLATALICLIGSLDREDSQPVPTTVEAN